MRTENEMNDYQTQTPKQGGIRMKRLLISMTILALLIVPQFALGADVDDFKAEVEKYVQAFSSMDASTIGQTAHPGLVVYNTTSPFPTVYPDSAALSEGMKSYFSTLESLNITYVNPQYRVNGNYGLTWGYQSSVAKPKDGPETSDHYRITMTFIKSGGKWLVSSIHMSKLPSGS
jgi:ketosteroid isomerase-like protein